MNHRGGDLLAGTAAAAGAVTAAVTVVVLPPRYGFAALGAVIFTASVGILLARSAGSPVAARRVLWLGAVTPFLFSLDRTADQVSSAGLTPLDVVRGGGPFVGIAIALLVAAPTHPKRFGLPEIALLGFLATALFSTAWSINPAVTALKALVLVGCYISLLLLVRYYETPRGAIDGVATAIYIVIAATAATAVLLPGRAYTPIESGQNSRLTGVFPQASPNILAMLAVVGLIALLAGVGPKFVVQKVPVRVLFVALAFGEVIATRTRTALAFGLVALLVAFLWLARRSVPLQLAGILGVPAVAVTALALEPVAAAFLRRGQSAQGLSTLTGRTDVWNLALQVWEQHPWLGTGYYAGTRLGLRGLYSEISNADNTWIETLLDVGVIGCTLLAFFWLAGSLRILVWRKTLPVGYTVFAVATMLAYTAQSFFNPTAQQPSWSLLIIGVVLLSFARPADQPQKAPAAPTPVRARVSPGR